MPLANRLLRRKLSLLLYAMLRSLPPPWNCGLHPAGPCTAAGAPAGSAPPRPPESRPARRVPEQASRTHPRAADRARLPTNHLTVRQEKGAGSTRPGRSRKGGTYGYMALGIPVSLLLPLSRNATLQSEACALSAWSPISRSRAHRCGKPL